MKTSLACAIALAVMPTMLSGIQHIGPTSLFDSKTFNGWEGNLALFRMVSGFQADMGIGWWGALYDESRRKRVLNGPDQAKMKDVIREGEWNDYTIRAEGPRVQLSINGFQTVDYVETDPTVTDSGVICVQIHGGPPSEAWYRGITIAELKQ